MTFSQALEDLKVGYKVQRKGWYGNWMYVQLQRPFREGRITHPYLVLGFADDQYVPWIPTMLDILADDWELTGTRHGP